LEANARAREIVRTWGWNATSYQILNPGFQLWLDEDNDAVVGYVECHGVRVVGGAPICADARLSAVIRAFELDAVAHERDVVYFCAEDRLAELALCEPRRMAFPIGAQPFWQPSVLLKQFRTHSSLRAQLNRARNKGVSVIAPDSRDALVMEALESCLEEWKQQRGLPPLHFLIESATLRNLNDRILLVAQRQERVVGFLVATPVPARSGWLVEQLVRGSAAPNGTMELLLHEVTRRVDALGAGLITLGLAPLAHRGAPRVDRAPGWLTAIFGFLRGHAQRFYNFRGLEAFKAKFGAAQWSPVYCVLSPGSHLGRAMLAITAAFAGEPLRQFLPRALMRGLTNELHHNS
jgi:phosphatidylglycerol lysyltransferase